MTISMASLTGSSAFTRRARAIGSPLLCAAEAKSHVAAPGSMARSTNVSAVALPRAGEHLKNHGIINLRNSGRRLLT